MQSSSSNFSKTDDPKKEKQKKWFTTITLILSIGVILYFLFTTDGLDTLMQISKKRTNHLKPRLCRLGFK